MNNKKGITIIILIVTIVVLIILSALAVSLLTDEDFINETEKVVSEIEIQEIVTAIKLEIRQYRLDKELENIYEITETEIINIIQKYGSVQTIDGEDFLINEEEGYKIKLSDLDPIFK